MEGTFAPPSIRRDNVCIWPLPHDTNVTVFFVGCVTDHFDRLYNLDEKYTWDKRCLCFNKQRVKVEDYADVYERVQDSTFAHLDPENHHYDDQPRENEGKGAWKIEGGWIAEVRINHRVDTCMGGSKRCSGASNYIGMKSL